MLISVLKYTAAFLLGRYSCLYFRNKYLEDKKEELVKYHAELLRIQEMLERKDEQIRQKWQSMIADISKYDMAQRPDSGKWTDVDDIYFNSWNSAEK